MIWATSILIYSLIAIATYIRLGNRDKRYAQESGIELVDLFSAPRLFFSIIWPFLVIYLITKIHRLEKDIQRWEREHPLCDRIYLEQYITNKILKGG